MKALAKKTEYQEALAIDEKEAPKLFAEYLESYELQKKAIAAYNDTIDKQIEEYNNSIIRYKNYKNTLFTSIKNNTVLHPNDKNRTTVFALIDYINRRRASTVQEALNLLDNEKRRAEQEKRINAFMKNLESEVNKVKQQQAQNMQQINAQLEQIRYEAEEAQRRNQRLLELRNEEIRKASAEANRRLESINADIDIAKHQHNSTMQSINAKMYEIDRKL